MADTEPKSNEKGGSTDNGPGKPTLALLFKRGCTQANTFLEGTRQDAPLFLRAVTNAFRAGVVIALLAILFYGVSGLLEPATTPVATSSTGEAEPGALGQQLFQIFFLLVVLGGSVGAVAYALMKHDLTSTARALVDDRIAEGARKIRERQTKEMWYGAYIAEAKAYHGIGMGFLRHYDPDFQYITKELTGSSEKKRSFPNYLPDLLNRDVQAAKRITDNGLKRLHQNFPSDPPRDKILAYYFEQARKWELLLQNHFIYHRTVERVLESVQKTRDGGNIWDKLKTQDETVDYTEAREKAEDILKLVNAGKLVDYGIGDHWHEYYDTVGFCLAISSCSRDRVKGRKLIEDAAWKKAPDGHTEPSADDRARIWTEHKDRFGLQRTAPDGQQG